LTGQARQIKSARSIQKGRTTMKVQIKRKLEEGKVGWILLWLLGIPIPILLLIFLLRGCT